MMGYSVLGTVTGPGKGEKIIDKYLEYWRYFSERERSDTPKKENKYVIYCCCNKSYERNKAKQNRGPIS